MAPWQTREAARFDRYVSPRGCGYGRARGLREREDKYTGETVVRILDVEMHTCHARAPSGAAVSRDPRANPKTARPGAQELSTPRALATGAAHGGVCAAPRARRIALTPLCGHDAHTGCADVHARHSTRCV
eukprot:1461166-Prymnesium_polylepis.2